MGGGRSTMRAESSAVMLIVSFGYTLTEQRSCHNGRILLQESFAASCPLSIHVPSIHLLEGWLKEDLLTEVT
jgi:hypothetical protein